MRAPIGHTVRHTCLTDKTCCLSVSSVVTLLARRSSLAFLPAITLLRKVPLRPLTALAWLDLSLLPFRSLACLPLLDMSLLRNVHPLLTLLNLSLLPFRSLACLNLSLLRNVNLAFLALRTILSLGSLLLGLTLLRDVNLAFLALRTGLTLMLR
ncbi:MAG: hypothetical protein H0V76_10735 [Blastocatellia bacterium]|nr:hypothetical protein [Blastocatellia bacterium]